MIICFRNGQNEHTVANDPKVTIYAPHWVQKCLETLSPHIKNKVFNIENSQKTWKIQGKMTLKDLVAIGKNTWQGSLEGVMAPEVNLALRDLAKQCIVVGKDTITHYNEKHEVYVLECTSNLSPQHVLITENNNKDLNAGLLDNEIYQAVVGEGKKFTYAQALKDNSKRFIPWTFDNKKVMFDTKAFQSYVAQDFMLAVNALNETAKENNDALNFDFSHIFNPMLEANSNFIRLHFAMGILKGLNQLLEQNVNLLSQIKRLGIPSDDNNDIKKVHAIIQALCEKHKIEFACNQGTVCYLPKYKTVTLICPNWDLRNDRLMAQLQGKGDKLNPLCNSQIGEQYEHYVQLKHPPTPPKASQINIRKWIAYYQWPLVATAISLLVLLSLKVTLFPLIGLSASVFMLTKLIEHGRDQFKKQQYEEYRHKSQADLNQLNETQLNSFISGYLAANNPKQQAWSCCQWQTYRAPKAYYAGVEAKLQGNQDLKVKIKDKLIQKTKP